jgi:(E)-4-hydroxy-3-methylbut-2-enyl-diphosphate synthase
MVTRRIRIGDVEIGGGAPVSVQTMTKTDTRDVNTTLDQIKEISAAGCDIVRLAVPDDEAVEALGRIIPLSPLPLVADIHFDYRLALKAVKYGVHGLRINPGNIGSKERVKEIVSALKDTNIPVRIGINGGSLEKDLLDTYGNTPEAMVESAKRHIGYLEEFNFTDIKVSLKSSDVLQTVNACRLFHKAFDYPQHIGVTEAGTAGIGLVKSYIGIGSLLADGIGDTIRVSLTDHPVKEIKAGRDILKALNLLPDCPKFVSCPTCGRLEFNIRKYAPIIEEEVNKLKTGLTIAVMGCAVNGPGEAKEADVALCGGKGYGAIYKKGKLIKKVSEEEVVNTFLQTVHEVIENEKKGDA